MAPSSESHLDDLLIISGPEAIRAATVASSGYVLSGKKRKTDDDEALRPLSTKDETPRWIADIAVSLAPATPHKKAKFSEPRKGPKLVIIRPYLRPKPKLTIIRPYLR